MKQVKPCSKIFLLTVPRQSFFYGYLCYLCLVFVMLSCASVYWWLVVICWERADLLAPRLWCLIVKLSLSHWYPWTGVVLDCMDSWYLHSFLLSMVTKSSWVVKTMIPEVNLSKISLQRMTYVLWIILSFSKYEVFYIYWSFLLSSITVSWL